MSRVLIVFVQLYRIAISNFLPPVCRYSPTCSQYMISSIKKHGSILGCINGICRLFRCHPWSKHDYWDPIK